MNQKVSLFCFAITLFLSAFLLFIIQPVVGKMLLPLLGGAPAVWNTCMVFFQLLLLAGYLYAHFLTTRFPLKFQALIHFLLLLSVFYFLPIRLPENLDTPSGSFPVVEVFELLFKIVGLPFFALSASAPFLQKWFSYLSQKDSKDPYFLYAASNAGSLIALFSYPFLIEPFWPVKEQASLWAFIFAVFVGLFLAVYFMQEKTEVQKEISQEKIYFSRKIRWVFLAFIPSSLMLGVTTHITTDIAAVPLLWIMPLALYLCSFIFVFSKKEVISAGIIEKIFPRAIMCLALAIAVQIASPISLVLAVHLTAFFIIAMLCHGRLALDRPSAESLTEYYLWMSAGGALGGIFNALLAPILFNSLVEYPLIIALSCLAYPALQKSASSRERIFDFVWPLGLALVTWFLFRYFLIEDSEAHSATKVKLFLCAGIPILIAFSFHKRPIRFALAVGFLMMIGLFFHSINESVLLTKRSFFAVSKIKEVRTKSNRYHVYMHGTTMHGSQNLDPRFDNEPLNYFSKEGPFGEIMRQFEHKKLKQKKVAIIGLGAGAMASYAERGEEWDFYEIDPVTVAIAEDKRYFSFMKNSKGAYKVFLGDGRLNLKKAPDKSYDLIVLDAFSSDMIPMHLVTREALTIYLSKLKSKGLIVMQITNRYLRLEAPLRCVGESLGLKVYVKESPWFGEMKNSSKWLVMSREEADAEKLVTDFGWKKSTAESYFSRPWTDDYSNILGAL